MCLYLSATLHCSPAHVSPRHTVSVCQCVCVSASVCVCVNEPVEATGHRREEEGRPPCSSSSQRNLLLCKHSFPPTLDPPAPNPPHPSNPDPLTHSLTHPLTHSARLLAFSVWCEHTGESRELLLLLSLLFSVALQILSSFVTGCPVCILLPHPSIHLFRLPSTP